MLLYLVEHAEAKPAEINPARGLTAAKKHLSQRENKDP